MDIRQTSIHKLFASLSDAQIACLLAELEDNPGNLIEKFKLYTNQWTPERINAAVEKANDLFTVTVRKSTGGIIGS